MAKASSKNLSRSSTGKSTSRKRLSRKKIIVIVIAVILVAALAGWFIWTKTLGNKSVAAGQTMTAEVTTTTFDSAVSATGTLTPAYSDTVSFESSGTVTEVKVEVGDTVTAGQVLATIDTLQLEQSKASAYADLLEAEAAVSEAKSDSDGSDAAVARISARESAVTVAQETYDQAVSDMDNAELTAPEAGLITSVDLEVGDIISTGSSSSGTTSGGTGGTTGAMGGSGTSGTGTTSGSSTSGGISIVSQNDWTVSVSVSESDIENLAIDNQVEMTVDGVEDTVYGIVASIAKIPSTSSSSVTYPVEIQVTGTPEGLYDGVSVTASIIYERRSDVLAVTSTAISRSEESVTVELVQDDGSTVTTEVEVGETVGQMTEIVLGLSEGDQVSYSIGMGSTEVSEDGGGQDMPTMGDMPEMNGDMGGGGGQMPGGGGGQMPGGGN